MQPSTTLADRFPSVRLAHWLDSRPGRATVAVLLMLALITAIVETGTVRRSEQHSGPFKSEQAGEPIAIKVAQQRLAAAFMEIRRPIWSSGRMSPITVAVNGEHYEQGRRITQGTPKAFAFVKKRVRLLLPEAKARSGETIVAVGYTLRLKSELVTGLLLALGAIGLVRIPRGAVGLPQGFLLVTARIGIALMALWALAGLLAAILGHALPPAAALSWTGLGRTAAAFEAYIGPALLALLLAARISRIYARSDAPLEALLDDRDARLGHLLARFGLALALALFLLPVAASWMGLVRQGDLTGSGFFGLLSFSDAQGYTAAAYDQIRDGTWNVISLRRPLAASARSLLYVLAGQSFPLMLALQAVLLGTMVFAATVAITRWRGILAGLAFFAVMLIVARPFLATTLTEPLGLIWAVAAIPFVVSAPRCNRAEPALVAVALTAIALFTRMGAMFVLPALLLWIMLAHGETAWSRLRLMAAGLVLIGCVVLAGRLATIEDRTSSGLVGSNFAFTLCGISIGDNWASCPRNFPELMQGETEKIVTDKLYAKAFENLRLSPGVAARRLIEGGAQFGLGLPGKMARGPIGVPMPIVHPAPLAVFVGLVLAVIGLATHRNRAHIGFWALLWAGIIGSGAVVHFDEGYRVMSVAYPFVALFIALGFATRYHDDHTSIPLPLGRPLAAIAAVLGTLLVAPKIAHVLWRESLTVAGHGQPTAAQHLIAGGKRITGFLVIADGAPLPKGVPAFHVSALEEHLKASNVEQYQGLLHPTRPVLPFAFISVPRLERGADSSGLYIGPTELLLNRDVTHWRLDITGWNPVAPFGPYWYRVTKAEPIKP